MMYNRNGKISKKYVNPLEVKKHNEQIDYDVGFWQMEESEKRRDAAILRWRKEWDQ